ncbi:hypothetical protein PR048_018493 [Dryococelus australis]|uniref:HTH psq-type domain-containing protein n=1 Tax=Dryococelus australis TaxID=614101 RepID=A0ABQ9HCJ9_9NEOP|nr:hypothetical protein PR048_018493 [Dryococelus australis]
MCPPLRDVGGCYRFEQLQHQQIGSLTFLFITRLFRGMTYSYVPNAVAYLTGAELSFQKQLQCSIFSRIVRRSFARDNRAERCRWSVGFLRSFPVPPPPPFHSDATPYSPRFTLTGSRDLDVKSRRNLLTHSLLEVKGKILPVREASRRFGVPRRAFRRYRSDVKSKLGCKPTPSAEQELSSYISFYVMHCFSLMFSDTVVIMGYTTNVSKGKMKFWNRNPEVAKRRAQRLNPISAEKIKKAIATDYFEKLRETLLDNN